jgi:predicted transcriptional regulator
MEILRQALEAQLRQTTVKACAKRANISAKTLSRFLHGATIRKTTMRKLTRILPSTIRAKVVVH